MTTTTNPAEAFRRMRETRIATILAAPAVAREVTTEACFDIPGGIILPDNPTMRLDAVKVRITRIIDPVDDEDREGFGLATGTFTPLRADGQPAQNKPQSVLPLDDEIAAPFITRALFR